MRSHLRSPRRLVRALAVSMLVAAALAGLWLAASPKPASLNARVSEVASGLRCPSCDGQSVAASESDLAREMRQVTAEQLADGRSPDQIRAWFVARYGNEVLLDPPQQGLGLVLRVVPFLVLAIGGVVLARRIGGRRGLVIGATLAVGLGGVLLGTDALRLQPSAEAGSWAPPAAATTPPQSPRSTADSSASRSALGELAAGVVSSAERQARAPMEHAQPGSRDWQDALLVLGLAQRQGKDPAAAATPLRCCAFCE